MESSACGAVKSPPSHREEGRQNSLLVEPDGFARYSFLSASSVCFCHALGNAGGTAPSASCFLDSAGFFYFVNLPKGTIDHEKRTGKDL